jgi:hypothetical protein
MKKTLISILFSLFAITANADHESDLGNYYFTQVPALCGKPELIENYLNHYNFMPQNISLGREGMSEEGQAVYMVTYYVNEDGTQTTATIDVPNSTERCILFHSFDLYIVK